MALRGKMSVRVVVLEDFTFVSSMSWNLVILKVVVTTLHWKLRCKPINEWFVS